MSGADDVARKELLREAASVDAEIGTASKEAGGPEEGAPKEKPPLSTQQNIAAILGAVVSIIGPLLPTVKQVYNEANIKAIAQETAPLIEKYGWQNAVGFGRWEPEFRALSIVLAISGPTIQAARIDIERLKAMAKGAKPPEESADKTPEGGAPPAAGLKE